MSGRVRVVVLAVVAAAVVLPLLMGGFWLQLATVMALYALAAVGLDLTFGRAGLLSVGHAAFFGIGGYVVALIGRDLTLPGVLLLLLAVAASALAGLLVGMVSLRVEGFYFALLTLATAIIFASVIRGLSVTGGPSGIAGISRNLLGTGELTRGSMYLIAVGCLTAAIAGLRNLRRSRTGRALEAVRTQPTTAAACGVDTFQMRLVAFTFGAALAGLAGGLFAQTLRYISPEFVGLVQSVEFLVMTVIGGLGTMWGTIAGVIVVRGLPEVVQALRDWQLVLLGLLTLLVLLRFRLGIAGTIEERLRQHRQTTRPAPTRTAPPASAAASTATRVSTPKPRASAATSTPLLEVQGVTRHFGGLTAVDDVDLHAHPGQIHALVGPNGAGKTTLINIVTGIDRPSRGKILFRGDDITSLAAHQRGRLGMARTFQLVGLAETMSLLENVMLGAYANATGGFFRGMVAPRRQADEQRTRAAAHELLERLGLADVAHLRPGEVPIGQRRLVEVARCLIGGSSLILLDEPAAGLNETETHALGQRLREIRDAGTAIVLIEHDMPLVMEISDQVTVLNFGARIAVGDPEAVAASPEVIEAYLGGDATAEPGGSR